MLSHYVKPATSDSVELATTRIPVYLAKWLTAAIIQRCLDVKVGKGLKQFAPIPLRGCTGEKKTAKYSGCCGCAALVGFVFLACLYILVDWSISRLSRNKLRALGNTFSKMKGDSIEVVVDFLNKLFLKLAEK